MSWYRKMVRRMEGGGFGRICARTFIAALSMMMVLGQGGLNWSSAGSDATDDGTRGSSEMTWTQTTQEDFLNGSLLNVAAVMPGEVILDSTSNAVIDDFSDESGIGHKEGEIVVDTVAGEVRLSGADVLLINKTFGGPTHDYGNTVQPTSDGGYVIGGTTGSYGLDLADMWLIKTDSAGNEQWNRTYGATDGDYGMSVLQTSDGGYSVLGITSSYGAGDVDAWLVKTDSAGNEQWNRTFGGSGSDWGQAIQQTSDNGYIIAGITEPAVLGNLWLIKTDALGIELWNRTYGGTGWDYGFSVEQTSDGGYAAVGGTDSYGAGESDVWLIKTDALGVEQWNRTFGGPLWDCGFSVEQTPDSGFIITGTTGDDASNKSDLWLIKTDSTGLEQWNRTFGGDRRDEGQTARRTSDGGYVVAGATASYGAGEMDVWLLKTDSSGNEQWNRTFGGSKWDVSSFHYFGVAVHQISDSIYTIGGTTESFGNGDWDVWLIKVNVSGVLQGSLVSADLLSGQGANSIDAFRCTTTVPAGTGLVVQFSRDALVWYDSQGNPDQWNTISDGANTVDLSGLGWQGHAFYYRMDFTSNVDNAPILYDIELWYSQYMQSGVLESEVFDSGTYPAWTMLNWSATIPLGTELRFQLRSGEDQDLTIEPFVGPDGSPATYYMISGQNIVQSHERHRWLQYKAYLSTTDGTVSPILEGVSVIYEPIDTDGDDVPDFDDTDDDNDGLPDSWESDRGFDPLDDSDASFDPDFDTLTNFQEFQIATNPWDNDTDGDALGDGFEVAFSKTNPAELDTNGNGVGDGLEFVQREAYMGIMERRPDDWIGVTISWKDHIVHVKTNSSVLDGSFDTKNRKLELTVSGPDDSQGTVEMSVPNDLCSPEDIDVIFDGVKIGHSLIQESNYCSIRVDYVHSTHNIVIVFGKVTDDPGGIWNAILALLASLAVVGVLLASIAATRSRKRKEVAVGELPPEKLSMLLEKKRSEGRMTDETYEDIKSLLKKYGSSGEEKSG